jgi:hypothetical protein
LKFRGGGDETSVSRYNVGIRPDVLPKKKITAVEPCLNNEADKFVI